MKKIDIGIVEDLLDLGRGTDNYAVGRIPNGGGVLHVEYLGVLIQFI